VILRILRVENPEKVLERLATKTTVVIAREQDGKMRVTSGSWEGEKVFARDQVLEVRPFRSATNLPVYLGGQDCLILVN
jgi:hypothetical protein